MSASRSVRPRPPSLLEAARLAARYERGEPLAALAKECGCWRHDLRCRLATLGILRPEDELPRRCRVCGEPVRSGTRRDLCAAHVRRFCSRCERRLPKGRQNRWCFLCAGEGKPEDYRLRRLLALRQPATCRECQALMPAGRIDPRCPPCAAARRQRLKAAKPIRLCAACREPLPGQRRVYCSACDQVQRNWRYHYRRGDPDAQALRPIRPYTHWQQREAPGC